MKMLRTSSQTRKNVLELLLPLQFPGVHLGMMAGEQDLGHLECLSFVRE